MSTVSRQIDFLLSLPRFATDGTSAYKPGLERMRSVLSAMGNPEKRFDAVLVAGTNGKGTTCAAASAILDAHGLRVGLYTSPHLVNINERIRVGGVAVDDVWLEGAIGQARPVLEAHHCSFFESVTALALLFFAEAGVDVAVVEVGLGGRLDATNVLDPMASAVTTISLDHTEILGDTLTQIAHEKASIARRGRALLVGPVSDEAAKAIGATAGAIGATTEFVDETCRYAAKETGPGTIDFSIRTPHRYIERIDIPLSGLHYGGNLAVAVRIAEEVGTEVSDDAVGAGLREVRTRSGLSGRGDVLRSAPLTYFDVGHNPAGLEAMLAHAGRWTAGDLYVVFGCMADKPLAEMAQILGAHRASVFVVQLASTRAATPQQLRPLLQRAGASVFGSGSVLEGLARAGAIATMADTIVITGSHLLAPDIHALAARR